MAAHRRSIGLRPFGDLPTGHAGWADAARRRQASLFTQGEHRPPRSRPLVTIELGERLPQGWRRRWTASDGELLESDPRVRPLLEIMAAMWDGVAIDLLPDDGGR